VPQERQEKLATLVIPVTREKQEPQERQVAQEKLVILVIQVTREKPVPQEKLVAQDPLVLKEHDFSLERALLLRILETLEISTSTCHLVCYMALASNAFKKA
jgi:hypothetical protein